MTPKLAIALRAYPGVSKEPIVHPKDKWRLFTVVLRSLAASGVPREGTVIHVMLDNCPDSYVELTKELLPGYELVFHRLVKVGNHGTFLMQIDLLLKSGAPIVAFVEDDYIFLENSFTEALEFMTKHADADFVTLYDHKDYYTESIHRYPREMRLGTLRHWQTVSSTCLTFLVKRDALIDAADTLRSYAKDNWDSSMFMALTKLGFWQPRDWWRVFVRQRWGTNLMRYTYKRAVKFSFFRLLFGKRYKLWSPVPALATHMETVTVSPGFDWKKEAERFDAEPRTKL